MITINLLPWRQRNQRREQRKRWLVLIAGLVILLSLIGWWCYTLDGERREVLRLLDEAAEMELGDVEELRPSLPAWERLKNVAESIRQVQFANQLCYRLLSRLLTELPDVVKLIAFNWRAGQFSIEGVVQNEVILQQVVDWCHSYQYRIKSITSKRLVGQTLSFKIEAK